jgi:hypothetical protein
MRLGMKVVDIADRRIGELTAIDGERFRVSLFGGDALWLSAGAFLTVRQDEVQVVCDAAGLTRYQVD